MQEATHCLRVARGAGNPSVGRATCRRCLSSENRSPEQRGEDQNLQPICKFALLCTSWRRTKAKTWGLHNRRFRAKGRLPPCIARSYPVTPRVALAWRAALRCEGILKMAPSSEPCFRGSQDVDVIPVANLLTQLLFPPGYFVVFYTMFSSGRGRGACRKAILFTRGIPVNHLCPGMMLRIGKRSLTLIHYFISNNRSMNENLQSPNVPIFHSAFVLWS